MLYPGPINNLCFLLTFINILEYFNVKRLPLFYTNKFNQYKTLGHIPNNLKAHLSSRFKMKLDIFECPSSQRGEKYSYFICEESQLEPERSS